MVKIFLDPGHGGNDPGATGYGLKEKDLTLTIAKKIAAKLAQYEKVTCKLSRTTDKTLSLGTRTKMANDWQADYLLSVHINAGGGTGYEDFIYNGTVNKNTARLRDIMHSEISKQLKIVRNRGKKTANFHMLRESKMAAMLTENLFIDTKADAALLKKDSFLELIATAHTNGLVKAFKLTKKSTSQPVDNNKFYRVITGSFHDRANAYKQVDKLKKLGITDVFVDIYYKK